MIIQALQAVLSRRFEAFVAKKTLQIPMFFALPKPKTTLFTFLFLPQVGLPCVAKHNFYIRDGDKNIAFAFQTEPKIV